MLKCTCRLVNTLHTATLAVHLQSVRLNNHTAGSTDVVAFPPVTRVSSVSHAHTYICTRKHSPHSPHWRPFSNPCASTTTLQGLAPHRRVTLPSVTRIPVVQTRLSEPKRHAFARLNCTLQGYWLEDRAPMQVIVALVVPVRGIPSWQMRLAVACPPPSLSWVLTCGTGKHSHAEPKLTCRTDADIHVCAVLMFLAQGGRGQVQLQPLIPLDVP